MREAASGLAATITAISRLPESVQHRQLDLESQRIKQGFELEKHQIDVLANDRREERAVTQRTESLHFRLTLLVTSALLGLVIYLFVIGQSQVATPILTLALGAASGWIGGNGYAKAKLKKENDL